MPLVFPNTFSLSRIFLYSFWAFCLSFTLKSNIQYYSAYAEPVFKKSTVSPWADHFYNSLDLDHTFQDLLEFSLDHSGATPLQFYSKSLASLRLTQPKNAPSLTGYPCAYQETLKPDTCLGYNWGATGLLINPVELKSTDRYKTRDVRGAKKGRNFGLPEMIDAIIRAVDTVHEVHPNTKRLIIGDLSRYKGGHFPPHRSHQSGRDADIGYYIKGKYQPEYLQRVQARQLDVPRTWTFIYSFLKEDAVQYIFMDYRLQRPLYKYARDVVKLSPKLLRRYFSYPHRRGGGIIRHLKGHADHMHVRFWTRQSLIAGKLYLKKHGRKALRPVPVYYRLRRGDNLIKIARRFRVSWKKLMRWNRLSRRKVRRLRPGQRLKVGTRLPPLPPP
jgi:hypothetical protein